MSAVVSSEAAAAESKALCDFIKDSDAAFVTAFLQRPDLNTIANARSPEGDYPLLVAARKSNVDALTALLKAGADPNVRCHTSGTFGGYTAMHFAAANGDTGSLEALVTHGGDVNGLSDDEWSALHVAAYKDRHQALEWLVNHGANVNAATKSAGQRALLFAVSHGRPADTRLLLQHGADTTLVTDEDGNTVLHHACCYPMSKLLDGQYDVPDVHLDVLVALLIRGNTSPMEVNVVGDVATTYWSRALPSIQHFCELVFGCRSRLRTSKHEWNYMSLATTKVSALTSVGISPTDADALFQAARAVDEERLVKAMRTTPRTVTDSHHAASHTLKTHNGAPLDLNSVAASADPSGGKCPFFQRGDGHQAHVPKGSVPPSASSYQHDPSGGKCPFFKGLPAEPSVDKPMCPFSLAYVKRHGHQAASLALCFLLGVAVDRVVLKLQRAT